MIPFLLILLLLNIFAWWHLIRAPRGYQDETGFHFGDKP